MKCTILEYDTDKLIGETEVKEAPEVCGPEYGYFKPFVYNNKEYVIKSRGFGSGVVIHVIPYSR